MILDGKKLSESILLNLKNELIKRKIKPTLSIVLCGDNPESIMYTNLKKKRGKEIGINVNIHHFSSNASEGEVILKIKKLNQISDGLIVQLPLPSNMNTKEIIKAIDSSKDVDGLTIFNLGKVTIGNEKLLPATPKGVIKLLEEYKIKIEGKNVVIINDSNMVGRPLAMMMLNRNATVTVCNKFTTNLKEYTKRADILIIGVGIPNFIKKDMIKQGAVIIDIGITKKNNKIFGDVAFEEVKEKASYITPVPGGVGPMTVAMLLENVILALEKSKEED